MCILLKLNPFNCHCIIFSIIDISILRSNICFGYISNDFDRMAFIIIFFSRFLIYKQCISESINLNFFFSRFNSTYYHTCCKCSILSNNSLKENLSFGINNSLILNTNLTITFIVRSSEQLFPSCSANHHQFLRTFSSWTSRNSQRSN